MDSPQKSRKRRPDSAASEKMITRTTTNTSNSTGQDEHGAIIAADSANGLFRYLWQAALDVEIDNGNEVSADTLQAKYGLPDLGNATGGIFLAAHRAGLIRRVGYRPSDRSSRAGGIIAVWGPVSKEAA